MSNPTVMQVGQCYYVRTVTDHWVGRVVAIGPHSVALEECSWVADSGRLSEFIAKGETEQMEIEYVGDYTTKWLGFAPWPHKLFKESK